MISGDPSDQSGTSPSAGESEASSGEQPPDSAPSVVIVDPVLPAAPSEQKAKDYADNCDAACQHDKDDLAAQQGMNTAAWGMFWATLFGVLLGAGTLFLVWRTVIYTKNAAKSAADAVIEAEKATKAALDSVEVARVTGRHQLQAYVQVRSADIDFSSGNPRIIFTCSNTGQTPATYFEVGSVAVEMPREEVHKFRLADQQLSFKRWGGLGRDELLTCPCLAENIVELLRNRVKRSSMQTSDLLLVCGSVRYGTIFGETYETEFAFFAYGMSGAEDRKLQRPVMRLRTFEKATA